MDENRIPAHLLERARLAREKASTNADDRIGDAWKDPSYPETPLTRPRTFKEMLETAMDTPTPPKPKPTDKELGEEFGREMKAAWQLAKPHLGRALELLIELGERMKP